MNLAVLAVYKLDDGLLPLLELHLKRFAEDTTVPYTIHGAAAAITPKVRRRLLLEPNLQLHDFPPTELSGAPEHSYYLEHLTRVACGGRVTHVLTTHLDAFPIRHGYAEHLAEKLSEGYAFASTRPVDTACLLFTPDVYEAIRPRYLVTEADRADVDFPRFAAEDDIAYHSGTGFRWAAFRAGLPWFALRCDQPLDKHPKLSLIEDVFCHLSSVVTLREVDPTTAAFSGVRALRRAERVFSAYRRLLPAPVRRLIRRLLGRSAERYVDAPRAATSRQVQEELCRRLFADPDGFIDDLRERIGSV